MKTKIYNILSGVLLAIAFILLVINIGLINNEPIDSNELQCEVHVCTMDYYANNYSYDPDSKICRCYNTAGIKTSETNMIIKNGN